MGHTYTNILLHVVFSTKDRAPIITDDLRPELLAYLGGAVRELGGTALLVNGPTTYTGSYDCPRILPWPNACGR